MILIIKTKHSHKALNIKQKCQLKYILKVKHEYLLKFVNNTKIGISENTFVSNFAFGLTILSDLLSLHPRTIAESPTWPIYNFEFLMIHILAVVPAVLGSPLAVLGHLSEKQYLFLDITWHYS